MATKTKAVVSPTLITIKNVRFSYVHVFEPTTMSDGSGDPKYSVSIIIPKADKAQVNAVVNAVKAAQELGISKKWGGKKPANLKMPIRDGDTDRPDDEAYKNSWFIGASSHIKPGIVDANVQAILDPTEFYSGCYGNVNVNFYPYASAGSKGIACGLNHVQKIKDGESLTGSISAEAAFGAPEEANEEEAGEIDPILGM